MLKRRRATERHSLRPALSSLPARLYRAALRQHTDHIDDHSPGSGENNASRSVMMRNGGLAVLLVLLTATSCRDARNRSDAAVPTDSSGGLAGSSGGGSTGSGGGNAAGTGGGAGGNGTGGSTGIAG